LKKKKTSIKGKRNQKNEGKIKKKKHKCWLKDKIENQQNSNKRVNDQNEKSKK
jgi:hypothetical protein